MKITALRARDIRFPTSREKDGSDALNLGDYSAVYVVLETDGPHAGYGLTFTNGHGTEIGVAVARALARLVVGRELEEITADFRGFYRRLTQDPQLRWIGPEKGIVHMTTGAVLNAIWDLWGRREGKPVWKLLADLTPQQTVDCVPFTWITDALTPDEALAILERNRATRAAREAEMRRDGFPAYTTSTGWLGYPDEKVRRLCREAIAQGFTHFKMKVSEDRDGNRRRAALMRAEIGRDRRLSMDANQCWDVGDAIEHVASPRRVRPVVDRGADEPGRRARPRGDREGDRADQGGDRRDVPEPRGLQAALPGGCSRLLPGRLLPRGRRQRGARDPPARGEVRRPGVSPRGRRGAVRVRPAPGDLRLRRPQPVHRRPLLRVRRSPARALRRAGEGRKQRATRLRSRRATRSR